MVKVVRFYLYCPSNCTIFLPIYGYGVFKFRVVLVYSSTTA